MTEDAIERWVRPRYVFGALALVLLLVAIFSPPSDPAPGRRRLTTFSSETYAARGIYLTLARLGWPVERQLGQLRRPLSPDATYLILDPDIEPAAAEASVILDAVRHGANVLIAGSNGGALYDSLGVRTTYPMFNATLLSPTAADSALSETVAISKAAQNVGSLNLTFAPLRKSKKSKEFEEDSTATFPADLIQIVRAEYSNRVRPLIVARQFGEGKVLAVADADFLRNWQVREEYSAILAVRLLEWFGPKRQRLVFDEYHHGFGTHDTLPSTVVHALVDTAPGRVVLQLIAASLLLLIFRGVRPIAPQPRQTIERRSPLEHVGALSQAYEQIAATRLATQHLVRGLRRRHPLGASGSLNDAQYLDLLSARKPAVAEDIDMLRTALKTPLAAERWVAVGGAVDHIERTFTL